MGMGNGEIGNGDRHSRNNKKDAFMISYMTLEQFENINRYNAEKRIFEHQQQLLKDFTKFISIRTNNFKKRIEFNEGAIFTNLYDGAMEELQKYHDWSLTEKMIFDNPESTLRQVLKIYKTW